MCVSESMEYNLCQCKSYHKATICNRGILISLVLHCIYPYVPIANGMYAENDFNFENS